MRSMYLALLLLAGCGWDQAARYYVPEKYPPKKPTEVVVLQAEPKQPHVVIADFQGRDMSVKDMQKWAAKIGADAVIVARFGGYRASSDQWAGEDSESRWYTRIAATAIKYTKGGP